MAVFLAGLHVVQISRSEIKALIKNLPMIQSPLFADRYPPTWWKTSCKEIRNAIDSESPVTLSEMASCAFIDSLLSVGKELPSIEIPLELAEAFDEFIRVFIPALAGNQLIGDRILDGGVLHFRGSGLWTFGSITTQEAITIGTNIDTEGGLPEVKMENERAIDCGLDGFTDLITEITEHPMEGDPRENYLVFFRRLADVQNGSGKEEEKVQERDEESTDVELVPANSPPEFVPVPAQEAEPESEREPEPEPKKEKEKFDIDKVETVALDWGDQNSTSNPKKR